MDDTNDKYTMTFESPETNPTKIDENEKARLRSFLPAYLQGKGIDPAKMFRCLNPEHEDRHPSMAYDAKHRRCHCFSCGVTYDLFDTIGALEGIDSFPDQYARALELFGSEPGNGPKTVTPSQRSPQQVPQRDYTADVRQYAMELDQSPALSYLQSRGISPQTAARFAIGYASSFQFSDHIGQAVIIPTGDMMHSFTARDISGNEDHVHRYENRGPAALFNEQALSGSADRPLFVVEGEIDALSIVEAGGEAVGLGSVSNADKFIAKAGQIADGRLVVLALDNDEPGQAGAEKIYTALKDTGAKYMKANLYGSCKDANEALVLDREGFTKRIADINANPEKAAEEIARATREEYIASNNVLGMMAGFLNRTHDPEYYKTIPTGFKQFDRSLVDRQAPPGTGGLTKSLYTIAAASSVGKTSFCLEIGDQVARSGKDVLIFSIEMSADELVAKSISRITHEIALKERNVELLAKTAQSILDGSRRKYFSQKEIAVIDRATAIYAEEYAPHLFFKVPKVGEKFDVDFIAQEVERHKEITGDYPLVIIDYLQKLKQLDKKKTAAENISDNIASLWTLAQGKTPILLISSLNRESYKKGNNGTVGMADSKGSGDIEYTTDTFISLEFAKAGEADFNEDDERAKESREVRTTIKKARLSQVGKKTTFRFYAEYNHFVEK